MKKILHLHVNENVKIALYALGFLTLIMTLTYIFWYA